MTPLISIIVPVYKVEKYLGRCIESLIRQTYQNCEIILVDDGSPDHCPQICEDYARKDARIQVIHKENGGQADARNTGVAVSKGELITFVDSDDYVTDDYVEYLYTLMVENHADISVGGRIVLKEDGTTGTTAILKTPGQDVCLNSHDAIKEMCYGRIMGTCPWGMLIKRKLVEQFPFPVGRIYEDLATMHKLLGQSELTVIGTKKIYFYQQNSSSTMHASVTERELRDGKYACSQLLDYINLNYPDLRKAARYRLVRKQLEFMPVIAKDKDYKHAKEIVTCIRPYLWSIVTDKDAPAVFKAAAAVTSCGGAVSMYFWRLVNLRRD
jgi:hypothetical protein